MLHFSSGKFRIDKGFVAIAVILLLQQGFSLRAQSSIDSLTTVLQKDSTRIPVLIRLSREIRRKGSAKEAESYARRALRLARKSHAYTTLDSALFEMAYVNYILGKSRTAASLVEERIAQELEHADSLSLARSYSFKGSLLEETGNTVGGLQWQLRAKAMADRADDADLQCVVLQCLGNFYNRRDPHKALDYRLEALHVSQQITDPELAALRKVESSNNLATSYLILGDLVHAKEYLRAIIRASRSPNFPLADAEAQACTSYAYILGLEEHYDSSIVYHEKAIAQRLRRRDYSRLADSYGLVGQVYLAAEKDDQALRALKESIRLSRESHALSLRHKWMPMLARAYALTGKHELAYETLLEDEALADSVMTEEKANAIARLEADYGIERTERENKILRQQHALERASNQKQKILLVSIAIATLMGGLVFYFRAQVRQQKNIRLQEKVDAQHRELATIALLVTRKNQALTDLKQRIEMLSAAPDAAGVKALMRNIDEEIDFDEAWNTFKYHFEKVHPDFFTRLKTVAPSLSVTELRLCAYVRAKLSTKEIAKLTNTTIRSVQQAKYRVNQKIMHGERTLTDYLMKM